MQCNDACRYPLHENCGKALLFELDSRTLSIDSMQPGFHLNKSESSLEMIGVRATARSAYYSD
jgi:hypothetical protein